MKFLTSERAVAEVIGHVIILGLTITGVAMITLVGVPAIYKLEDMINVRDIEQTYTMIDSRASRAIIGESPMQIVNINLGEGSIVTVEPNDTSRMSYMVIKSSNGTFNFAVPMGKIKYRLGERIVAYEGGGVWSKYPSGGSIMLSPPEFHFNGETLTLPVINISGNASIGGKGITTISFRKGSTQILYPNTSLDKNRTNPVIAQADEKVIVNIISDYYDAWADYAKSLAYTNVSENPGSKTASIELEISPPMGIFPIANQMKIKHLNTSNPNPLYNFSLYLTGEGQHLNNMEYEIQATKGSSTFQIHLEKDDGNKFELEIEYENETADHEEKWKIPLLSGPDSGWPDSINVDLLNKSMNLTFDEGSTNCTSWSPPIICSEDTTNMSVYDLMQHYMVLMGPDITFLTDEDEPSEHGYKNLDYSKSTYTLYYDAGSGSFIIYMHITKNDAVVSII